MLIYANLSKGGYFVGYDEGIMIVVDSSEDSECAGDV